MNPLLGRTITALEIAADKQALRFTLLDADPVIVRVDADCCSYTWVEHIELPALGFPAKVTAVEDLSLPQSFYDLHPGPPEQESLALYGCKITTDRGEIVIDYRNESNGYYGGWLAWPGERFYGGVFDQNNSKEEWQAVA